MQITRRTFFATGAAAVALSALPAAALVAPMQPAEAVADMFYTVDEPWAAFVRGHVSKDVFDRAVLHMVDTNSDHRENGEGWLFDERWDDDGEDTHRVVVAEPEYGYMVLGEPTPDLDETWYFGKAGDPGAVPITMARY